jgi:hypothetical protein
MRHEMANDTFGERYSPIYAFCVDKHKVSGDRAYWT